MSAFLLQAAEIISTSHADYMGFADMIYGDRVWVRPVGSWRGMRYPHKRFVADVEIDGQRPRVRYFRNRRKAERWARRFTENIRHL